MILYITILVTRNTYYTDFRTLLSAFFQPYYTHGLGSLKFSSGASPTVSRMCIYHGNSLTDARAPPLPLQCFHGNCYAESVELVEQDESVQGLKFFLVAEGKFITVNLFALVEVFQAFSGCTLQILCL